METTIIVLGVLWFSSFLALGLIIKAQNQEMQRLTRLGYDNSILQDQNSASIKKLMDLQNENSSRVKDLTERAMNIEHIVFPLRAFQTGRRVSSITDDINFINSGLYKLARELGYEITFEPDPDKVIIKKREDKK